MELIHTSAPDNPEGQTFRAAPPHHAKAIQRRFENRPVAVHPTEPNTYIYDPGNFWDGPTYVTYNRELGHFFFTGWDGPECFPLIGSLK